MRLRTIDDIREVRGKRVLLRLALNVPIANSIVTDTFRIDKILPTLQTLIDRGALVRVLTHLSIEGTEDIKDNSGLAPIEQYLREHVKGDFILHENLRHFNGEEANDPMFAKELASLGDLFVNEDFAVSHREHASVVGLPKLLPGFIGYQFKEEVDSLSTFLKPESPCILIVGGAKIKTKLPMIENFYDKADRIFLGSYYLNERDAVPNNPKVILPVDYAEKDGHIWDIGPESLKIMQDAVSSAKCIIWNGPLGQFETGYNKTTEDLAKSIANSSARTLVGGGDSVASIERLNILDRFTFVSTGGGAMLDFLAHGTLPGIEAILESQNLKV